MSKRPPPVPKFNLPQSNEKKNTQMQKKLDSFFTQLQQQAKQLRQPQILCKKSVQQQQQPNQPNSISSTNNNTVGVSKKFNLANINSKLNTMLSSKNINLNLLNIKKESDATKQPSTASNIMNPQKIQKKRSELTTQYDPNFPNNYDISKSYYTDKFTQMNKQSDQQYDQDKPIINQTGIGMRKLVQPQLQIQQQQQQIIPVIQEQVLQQKQQIALRMMQKFGYKVGSGLGKQSQGITTPLTIKKTTDSACIIQQSNINLNQIIKPQISAKNALLAHGISITQVIVFINLITIQQLNQQVEKQLKQQCLSYGDVKNWMVYLLKNNQAKQELRIFAQYYNKDAAFNAFFKLNNRYYDKNLASLRFYPKDEFQKYHLNLNVHDHVET